MYKKILAPLDGSKFSECSLEHVRAVAAGCKVPEVLFLMVIEPPSQPLERGENWSREVVERGRSWAEDYLAKVAKKLKKEGIAAQTTVLTGWPADQILDYADQNKADLIIMSTHGRSGVTRWVFGSVADRVLRHSKVPVLVVPPRGCRR
ncbi:MAG: universal stress protein [Dehalococcoidales bacterium]